LDIEKGVIFIHFPGKHTPEFKRGDRFLDGVEIRGYFVCGRFILFTNRKFQQFGAIFKGLQGIFEPGDYRFETGFFLAQLLCSRGITPDIGVFQFEQNLFQLFTFAIVVKDTPGANRPGFSGHRFAAKSDLSPLLWPTLEKTRILPDLSQQYHPLWSIFPLLHGLEYARQISDFEVTSVTRC
jgi:hypothetical protein